MYVDDPLFSLDLMGLKALHRPYQSLRIAESLSMGVDTSMIYRLWTDIVCSASNDIGRSTTVMDLFSVHQMAPAQWVSTNARLVRPSLNTRGVTLSSRWLV